jgi:hypothetical protein
MSRISGSEVKNLMEAYSEIYALEELTEEQVWKEVENWVNSLLEEGYDLSEYTWEEMYESYLNEMGQPGGNVPGGRQSTTRGAVTMYSSPRPNTGQSYQSRFARPMNANTPQSTGRGTSLSRPQIGGMGGLGAGYRGQELQAGARAAASQVGTPRQGSAGTGAAPSAASRPTTASSRPAGGQTVAASGGAGGSVTVGRQYAATQGGVKGNVTYNAQGQKTFTANKPASGAPTPSSSASGGPKITPTSATPKPTSAATPSGGNTLSQATAAASKPPAFSPKPQSDVGAMIARSQARQASQTPKPAASAPTRPMGGARARMLGASFDPFDVIKGHLIDEGYADTEEAALQIMANMSEEWRQEILDEAPRGLPYGPVGKGFKKLPAGRKREKMMKNEKK